MLVTIPGHGKNRLCVPVHRHLNFYKYKHTKKPSQSPKKYISAEKYMHTQPILFNPLKNMLSCLYNKKICLIIGLLSVLT